MTAIIWTEDEMIGTTCEWWGNGYRPEDCRVIRWNEPECLIVIHTPTGRTSDEAGGSGRWHLDGRAYHEKD